jgi:hypothetical protein
MADNAYIRYGSYGLTLPEKMLGYDKKGNPKLYKTLTKKKQLATSNKVLSLNLTAEPGNFQRIYPSAEGIDYVVMQPKVRRPYRRNPNAPPRAPRNSRIVREPAAPAAPRVSRRVIGMV